MSPAITDVAGIQVGHAQDLEALTGVSVVLTPAGAVAGVDVRGAAPGTRETDLLDPTASVQHVHAIALCGGSAMGLAAATGVVAWLQQHGYGFDVGLARVPIVPAAVLFDLGVGRADRFPDAAMGVAACEAASTVTPEGSIGAGTGASVGKVLGPAWAMKTGVGTWSERLADGTYVGALAVVNAFGDVWQEHGSILAGVRDEQGGFRRTDRLLRDPDRLPTFGGTARNTTLAVVATDATLTKADATRMAIMAQDGLARTIRPVHTPFDGDIVFALATAQRPEHSLLILGTVAADVLARAIERAATQAHARGGLPATPASGAEPSL
jgi:L-aminopeptidase/D-esterase-like protein